MSHADPARPLRSAGATPLRGRIRVPGDKSVSHRALMFAGLAIGKSRITGLLEGEDVLATAAAMRALGAWVERVEEGTWEVTGTGVGGLRQPHAHLDMGNSGTAARLLSGLLATHNLTATLTGDASLSSRPMQRIIDPLSRFGATFLAAEGGRIPFTMKGAGMPVPVTYELPVASAQVKSAVLLAGLNTPGDTVVIETHPTRDHTEIMLRNFGAALDSVREGGKTRITLHGPAELTACDVTVPGDPSSAAFPLAAALMTPGSDLVIENVLLNPTRTGLFDTLKEMGADITYQNARQQGGEEVADLRVRHSRLVGVTVPPARVMSMIDEFPILSVLASVAEGETRYTGAEDLRVKESDRISVVAEGLTANGADVEELEDGMIIRGTGGQAGAGNASGIAGGARVASHLDHRIAMSFLMLGLVSDEPVSVDDAGPINTSFPGFVDLMNGLGAQIGETG